jgi:hypothetical protein
MGKVLDTIDTSGWLRREEVKNILGCSMPKIQRLQASDDLTPVEVDGIYFYDPAEVETVKRELDKKKTLLENGPSKGNVDAYMYETMKAIVNLVKDPREKIDDIQFKIIEKLMARVADLEKQLDAQKAAVEAAKDSTLERNMAIEQVRSEAKIKEMAAGRMVETIGKLVNGWGGNKLNFTPEQWEMLLGANKDGEEPFLTPEQVKIGEDSIAKAKQAMNGKEVVKNVAKVVSSDQG